MKDVLLSEMTPGGLKIIEAAVRSGREVCIVKADSDNQRYQISSHELFTEIIWCPISQLHAELVVHFESAIGWLDLADGDPSRFFSRPQSPSSFSAFLAGWVHSRLGVPPGLSTI